MSFRKSGLGGKNYNYKATEAENLMNSSGIPDGGILKVTLGVFRDSKAKISLYMT